VVRDDYREVPLGAAGIRYVSDQLYQGKTLARFLLQTQQLGSGHVSTFLPHSVPDTEAMNLRSGVLPEPPPETHTIMRAPDGTVTRAVPVSHMDEAFVPLLHSFLQGGGERLCIFENELLRPTDPVVSRLGERFVIYSDEVYTVLLRDDSESQIARTLLGTNDPWLAIGAMTSLPDLVATLGAMREITQDQLLACAQRAAGILVGAYDDEGWVLWRPGSATP
jgi:hypothetical protein